MKRKHALALVPIFGLIGILIFSSFYNPTKRGQTGPEPNPSPEVKYRGQSKQSNQRGLISMATAFQNDYFTSQSNEGYYYVEIAADQYRNSNYNRPPMHLSILIDRTGSMSDEKISYQNRLG